MVTLTTLIPTGTVRTRPCASPVTYAGTLFSSNATFNESKMVSLGGDTRHVCTWDTNVVERLIPGPLGGLT